MVELSVLDVGHGNSAVLWEGTRSVIIDAGPGPALLEFLSRAGITAVAAVLISHADADHLKGLVGLLGNTDIAVERVYVNSDAEKTSRQWQALAFDLDHRQRNGGLQFEVGLVEGDTFDLIGGTTVEVLAPRRALVTLGPGGMDDQDRRIRTNTISAVVRVHLPDGSRVMIPGDLDEVGLDHMLATRDEVAADVLVFPHHGGKVDPAATPIQNRAFTEHLVGAVAPQTVVFSFGRNTHDNPRPEVVAAVVAADQSPQVMCTQLSKHCATELPVEEPTHLGINFSSGQKRARCCAGTIGFGNGAPVPAPAEHSVFVDLHAPNALCRRPPDAGEAAESD